MLYGGHGAGNYPGPGMESHQMELAACIGLGPTETRKIVSVLVTFEAWDVESRYAYAYSWGCPCQPDILTPLWK